jgi:hypothetical protein
VTSYEYAKVILRRERDREQKRMDAAQTDVDLYSARIDYDEHAEHSNKSEIPEFTRKREQAEEHVEEHRKDVESLDAALAVLERAEKADD